MSLVNDAIRTIQQVLTLQIRMELLEASDRAAAADTKAIADGLFALTNRVARIEGFIEGAAAVSPRRARLPKA